MFQSLETLIIKKTCEKNKNDVNKHYSNNRNKILKTRVLNLRIKRGLPVLSRSFRIYNITKQDVIDALKKSQFDIPQQYDLLTQYAKLI